MDFKNITAMMKHHPLKLHYRTFIEN